MKRLYLITLLVCSVLITSDAQTKKKTNSKPQSKTNAKTGNTKQPEKKKKTEEIKISIGIFSHEELERQREEAFNEMELIAQLLTETNTNAANSLNRLNLLTQQLAIRKKTVSLLEQEVATIDLKINSINSEIVALEKDLTKIKENYAKSMQSQQQEHRTVQYKMLLILSAENLSQSYRRMRYLKEYSIWQKEEANRIITKQNEINKRKEELEKMRNEKISLITQRTEEGRKIEKEEVIQQKEVSKLQKKQKDLQSELQKKQRNAEALNSQIEQLIAEDIKASKKNTSADIPEKMAEKEPEIKKEATKKNLAPASEMEETDKTASKNNYVMNESKSNLSKDFTSNKGRLPYPVTGSHTIVSSFGEHQHRELSHVKTNNNGIDIQTTAGTDARAIFKGVVTRVFVMPGFNYNIIIRHGDYLTVYSNISQVYVKVGDIVNTQQAIGKIYTDVEKGNETILHFQIWKERTKLNPASWIR